MAGGHAKTKTKKKLNPEIFSVVLQYKKWKSPERCERWNKKKLAAQQLEL